MVRQCMMCREQPATETVWSLVTYTSTSWTTFSPPLAQMPNSDRCGRSLSGKTRQESTFVLESTVTVFVTFMLNVFPCFPLKVTVNTNIADLNEYLLHILGSTNMKCLTPEKVIFQLFLIHAYRQWSFSAVRDLFLSGYVLKTGSFRHLRLHGCQSVRPVHFWRGRPGERQHRETHPPGSRRPSQWSHSHPGQEPGKGEVGEHSLK